MRRYKIRRYKDCEYLSHEDRKKHKYVAKIKLGKNKYRYFYTKKEYDAYLHKKKAVGDISNKAKSVADNIGDKIKKGQVLGYMGNTGNSFGAHLHVGIKKNIFIFSKSN